MTLQNTKAAPPDQENYAALQNTDDKQFYTLRAKLAMGGYMLSRSNPADGKIIYFSQKWGMVHSFSELAGVAEFLRQIGGGA
jgi:hypothetical protein